MKDYEVLLQKLEQDIREHISIEHQLKIQCEKYAENLDILEDEKIILLSQIDDERKEFNNQLQELTKQIEDYLKQKSNFVENEKKYKIELEKKNKEIIQMKEKIDLLNKNIKDLENQINNRTIEQLNQKSNNNTHNNQDEIIDYKNFNYSLSQQNFKTFNIRNVKNIYNKNNSNITNITNNNNKITLFNQNLQNQKKFNTKKLLLRNMSGTNIDSYNIDNSIKKSLISNYNNKNNSINESTGNYLYKINESEFNNISKDNSINYKKINNNNANSNNKLKLKLPVNITNNNYNMNKNNVMINLSTNIVSDNINLEKLKVQQKLVEYRKLIDKKINELINNKKRNTNQNKKRVKSTFDNGKSPKNYDLYKKVNISSVGSDYGRKSKKKINQISNTNYKYLSKEYFKNIHDKNIILPKKITGYDKKKMFKSNSQRHFKTKQSNNNKLNIIRNNICGKGKFILNICEDDKIDNKIHEQITSKGKDEEKSEDSKK